MNGLRSFLESWLLNLSIAFTVLAVLIIYLGAAY